MFSLTSAGLAALSLIMVLSARGIGGLELAEKTESLMVSEGEPFEILCGISDEWQWCYWQNGEEDKLQTTQGD